MSSQRTNDRFVWVLLLVLAIVVVGPMLMMAFAFPVMGMWGGTMGGFDQHQFSPLWSLGMLVVWLVVLLGGGYLLYRAFAGGDRAETDPALEELRLAYARGDLSAEEYEERRSRLESE